MKRLAMFAVAGALLTSIVAGIPAAQPQVSAASNGQIMFILDASSSMLVKDDTSSTRIDKAKAALGQALDSIPAETAVGLRVYGSQVPDTNQAEGCQDTRLLSGPATNNAAQLKSTLSNVQAKGWTLMGKSLQDVQQDFTGTGPRTVILISDGVDTCTPPSACEVAKNMSSNGVSVKVNTLGLLASNDARTQMQCIADNSGGNYFDIDNIDKLQSTLSSLTAREVSLFSTSGTPIKGSLRIEEAPLLLSDTFYTDTLTLPQELYYAVDALPNQNISVTVKGVSRDTQLSRTDYLHVTGYVQDTAKKLRSLRGTQAFGKSDVTTAVYEIDTAKEKLAKPERLAVQIATSKTKLAGTSLPLEIRVTTEGGDQPNNPSVDSASPTSKPGSSQMAASTIVLITLGTIVLLALLAYAVKKYVIDPRKTTTSPAGFTRESNTYTAVTPAESSDLKKHDDIQRPS